MSASGSASHGPRVGGLRVFDPTVPGPNPREFRTGDAEWRLVEQIMHHALMLLEDGPGRNALVDLGRNIILGRRGKAQDTMWPRRDRKVEGMPAAVNEFLRLMRRECPEVSFESFKVPGEAASIRYTWSEPTHTLANWRPQNGGMMKMHKMIIDEMLRTRSLEDRDVYFFQMVVSVAHEICHLFTGYLTGTERPKTPETLKLRGADGEAGFWWEARALGGIIEFFADPRYPTALNQPGIPYLFPDGEDNTVGQRVSLAYISRMAGRSQVFDMPIQLSSQGDRMSRTQLKKITNKMTELRSAEADRRAASAAAAAQASSSSSARNRMLPSNMQRYYY